MTRLKKLFFTKGNIERLLKLLGTSDRTSVLNRSVASLYNTIGSDDILKIIPNGLRFKGKLIPEEEGKGLKQEATLLLESKLWQMLRDDIRYEVNKKMYLESKDIMDITAGKLYLHALNSMERRLKELATD